MSKQLTIKNVTLHESKIIAVFNKTALIQLGDLKVFISKKWLHKKDETNFRAGIAKELEYTISNGEGQENTTVNGEYLFTNVSVNWESNSKMNQLFA